MSTIRPIVIAVCLLVSSQTGSAQELRQYRGYVLESRLDAVIVAAGQRSADIRVVHQRPALIQELTWRAPYRATGDARHDPVRDVTFAFYDEVLYRIVVTYDRDRTDGLTSGEILASMSASYGTPARQTNGPRRSTSIDGPSDGVVLARWADTDTQVTLTKGTYSDEFQLVLVSKSLSERARLAAREASRLDDIEGPRKQAEERRRDTAEAATARAKTREANKAGFRP